MVWLIEAVDFRLDQLIGRVGWLVPAPAALTTSALWCSLLQVHAASGPSADTCSTLRLVLRQLLGCGAEATRGVHEPLLKLFTV